jgi:hypothetical protein
MPFIEIDNREPPRNIVQGAGRKVFTFLRHTGQAILITTEATRWLT